MRRVGKSTFLAQFREDLIASGVDGSRWLFINEVQEVEEWERAVNSYFAERTAGPHSSRLYVQVAYLLKDEQTTEREFGNLEAIPDSYPKLVLQSPLLLRPPKLPPKRFPLLTAQTAYTLTDRQAHPAAARRSIIEEVPTRHCPSRRP